MDETTLRLLPPLRSAWAPEGKQARVPISGRNAQGSLYCALNLRTGRRASMTSHKQRQGAFQAFLRRLRMGRGAQGALFLLLDQHSSHTAKASLALAERLRITLLFLPVQCPSLNPVDHLWRELKKDMAANHQFATIEAALRHAQAWVHRLLPTEALRKAGLLSPTFWLGKVRKNFCHPT